MSRVACLARASGAVALAAALGWGSAVAGDELLLRVPKEEKLAFHGIVSLDGAGVGSANILYPAPNAAGLVAAVLTHGLLSGAARNSQKDKLQADADAVLEPYREILAAFGHAELAQRGLKLMTRPAVRRMAVEGESTAVVEASPVFFMTPDHRALVLDNAITGLRAASGSPSPVVVRVVSDARPGDRPTAHWTAENGEALKHATARLFAASMDLALQHAGVNAEAFPQRTVRYMEGGVERMERAHVVSRTCGRVLIVTLRGALMSVPARSADDACEGAGKPG